MNAPTTFLDAREWALDEFHAWQREGIRGRSQFDHNPREEVEFDVWLAAMSQPHIRDCERFRAAAERLTDDELVAHSQGQRRFGRGL